MKGKGLHTPLIASIAKQVLEVLKHLHWHKWYHMHLHTGNVLIDENNLVFVSELENFVNDVPIKNEQFFNYAFEHFTSDHILKHDCNSLALSEIFKNHYNIYEKIDIISFGRLIYEMATGRELKAPYPDDIEYKDLDENIVTILKLVFLKKDMKVNNKYCITVPETTADDLLKLPFFSAQYQEQGSLLCVNIQMLEIFQIFHIFQMLQIIQVNSTALSMFLNILMEMYFWSLITILSSKRMFSIKQHT